MSIIVLREYSGKHHTMIDYKCDVCGYIGSMRLAHYKTGIGCSVCAGKTVSVGINDLWTTAPQVAKYLDNPNDGFLLSKGTSKKSIFKCNVCGYKVEKPISQIVRKGFHCPRCSTGISYPNRVMDALLRKIGVEYEREMVFCWNAKRRYDFYVYPDIIIEMHGKQHYSNSFNGVEILQQEIDEQKILTAINNGIKNYVEIDSSVSTIDYISENILGSALSSLFDLSQIDWLEIDRQANKRLYDYTIKLYRDNISINNIAIQLKIDPNTVRKILKCATKDKLCSYSSYDSIIKSQRLASAARKKSIICTTTGCIYDSIQSASLATGISTKALSNCLRGRSQSTLLSNGNKLNWDYYIPERRGKQIGI